MSDKKIRRYALDCPDCRHRARRLGRGQPGPRPLRIWSRQNADAAIPTVTPPSPPNPVRPARRLVLPGAVQAFMEAPIYARTNGYLEILEYRHRHAGHQRTVARADRNPGSRSAIDPGAGRSGDGSGEREPVQEHQRALAGTARHAIGVQAGRGRKSRRCRREDGRRRFSRGQCGAAARFGIVQARGCSLHRRDYRPQYRRRRVDQRRAKHRNRTVSHCGYAQVAHFCTCAGTLRRGDQARARGRIAFHRTPQPHFSAKTVRTSNSLDPTLRTLQVELELDNAKGEIFPGAYAEVHFKLPPSAETLRLPANTVLFRSAGLQVATLDGQQRVKLKSIVQGRDFGNSIEVLSGLAPHETVVLNPPDSIADGVQVRIAVPDAAAPTANGKT